MTETITKQKIPDFAMLVSYQVSSHPISQSVLTCMTRSNSKMCESMVLLCSLGGAVYIQESGHTIHIKTQGLGYDILQYCKQGDILTFF